MLAATSPQAANRTFLASDGQDLSTGALIRRLRVHLRRSPRLVPVPPGVLETLARMAGRSGEFRKLAGNLQVDIADTRHRLGWTPPQSIDDGLRACVEDFRAVRKLAA